MAERIEGLDVAVVVAGVTAVGVGLWLTRSMVTAKKEQEPDVDRFDVDYALGGST